MSITVFGAAGHTGKFVVRELLRRGEPVIAIARDEEKLAACGFGPAVDTRIASTNDPQSLDRALSGAAAVVHCAGPFLDTAEALIEAALRARVHYFDVTAEQMSALSTFERFDDAARDRGIAVVPAAGFYGGLADLLATLATRGWTEVEKIDVAIALDSWWPTIGTRRTGRRNTAPRVNVTGGKLTPVQPSEPISWTFPEPFGMQEVVELPFTETLLMHRHLRVAEVRNYLNQTPLRDLRDQTTPEPVPADDQGRSKQIFVMDVVARNAHQERRVAVRGRDIYAVTAPLVAEAAQRICDGEFRDSGAFALGELFDAEAFLQALTPDHISLQIEYTGV